MGQIELLFPFVRYGLDGSTFFAPSYSDTTKTLGIFTGGLKIPVKNPSEVSSTESVNGLRAGTIQLQSLFSSEDRRQILLTRASCGKKGTSY